MIASVHSARACSSCIMIVLQMLYFPLGPYFELSCDHNYFVLYKKVVLYEQCSGSFRHVGRQILAFVSTNINVADQFFTSMCFESKKWVSMLVPCVLELYLELRRFTSMGKCWNT